MRYVSIFSGVEAATLAFGPLGWEPMAFAEVEPFPCAVLRARFPEVPNLGDVTKVDWSGFVRANGTPDVLVGGSPCQSFSVAGGRTGLDGASGLMWEYVRAVRELRPRVVLWENVPGALSSTHGEDFRCLLESLDGLGYGLAWRILDAQFFGVSQRRRRLFLVGFPGDGGAERACEVLFEPHCLRWDTPSSKEEREALAARARGGADAPDGGAGDVGVMTDTQPHGSVSDGDGVVGALSATMHKDPPVVIDRAAFSQGVGAKYPPHIEETDVMDTLVACGPHAVMW